VGFSHPWSLLPARPIVPWYATGGTPGGYSRPRHRPRGRGRGRWGGARCAPLRPHSVLSSSVRKTEWIDLAAEGGEEGEGDGEAGEEEGAGVAGVVLGLPQERRGGLAAHRGSQGQGKGQMQGRGQAQGQEGERPRTSAAGVGPGAPQGYPSPGKYKMINSLSPPPGPVTDVRPGVPRPFPSSSQQQQKGSGGARLEGERLEQSKRRLQESYHQIEESECQWQCPIACVGACVKVSVTRLG